jgi:hypothetical protein
MKYLITESQIDSIVFKYLNTQDFYHREDGGGHYFFESERSYKDNQYAKIAYYYMSDDCYISSDILTEVAEFFSLNLTRSLMIIAKWVEGKIGIEIKYPYSDYGAG